MTKVKMILKIVGGIALAIWCLPTVFVLFGLYHRWTNPGQKKHFKIRLKKLWKLISMVTELCCCYSNNLLPVFLWTEEAQQVTYVFMRLWLTEVTSVFYR